MRRFVFASFLLYLPSLFAAEITVQDGRAILRSESLERVIRFDGGNIRTISLTVAGRQMLAAPANEFSVLVTRESKNQMPRPFTVAEAGEKNYFTAGMRGRWRSEAFDASRYDDPRPDGPKWIEPLVLSGDRLGAKTAAEISRPSAGVTRLMLRADAAVDDLSIELCYEVYDGYAAVRKWVVVRNKGS
ncbi:MAG: hypothetical protein NTY38_09550, partial [Acidobacteria bacterium]|nr:hypothetical protein [Acidobacteriota bacterium]